MTLVIPAGSRQAVGRDSVPKVAPKPAPNAAPSKTTTPDRRSGTAGGNTPNSATDVGGKPPQSSIFPGLGSQTQSRDTRDLGTTTRNVARMPKGGHASGTASAADGYAGIISQQVAGRKSPSESFSSSLGPQVGGRLLPSQSQGGGGVIRKLHERESVPYGGATVVPTKEQQELSNARELNRIFENKARERAATEGRAPSELATMRTSGGVLVSGRPSKQEKSYFEGNVKAATTEVAGEKGEFVESFSAPQYGVQGMTFRQPVPVGEFERMIGAGQTTFVSREGIFNLTTIGKGPDEGKIGFEPLAMTPLISPSAKPEIKRVPSSDSDNELPTSWTSTTATSSIPKAGNLEPNYSGLMLKPKEVDDYTKEIEWWQPYENANILLSVGNTTMSPKDYITLLKSERSGLMVKYQANTALQGVLIGVGAGLPLVGTVPKLAGIGAELLKVGGGSVLLGQLNAGGKVKNAITTWGGGGAVTQTIGTVAGFAVDMGLGIGLYKGMSDIQRGITLRFTNPTVMATSETVNKITMLGDKPILVGSLGYKVGKDIKMVVDERLPQNAIFYSDVWGSGKVDLTKFMYVVAPEGYGDIKSPIGTVMSKTKRNVLGVNVEREEITTFRSEDYPIKNIPGSLSGGKIKYRPSAPAYAGESLGMRMPVESKYKAVFLDLEGERTTYSIGGRVLYTSTKMYDKPEILGKIILKENTYLKDLGGGEYRGVLTSYGKGISSETYLTDKVLGKSLQQKYYASSGRNAPDVRLDDDYAILPPNRGLAYKKDFKINFYDGSITNSGFYNPNEVDYFGQPISGNVNLNLRPLKNAIKKGDIKEVLGELRDLPRTFEHEKMHYLQDVARENDVFDRMAPLQKASMINSLKTVDRREGSDLFDYYLARKAGYTRMGYDNPTSFAMAEIPAVTSEYYGFDWLKRGIEQSPSEITTHYGRFLKDVYTRRNMLDRLGATIEQNNAGFLGTTTYAPKMSNVKVGGANKFLLIDTRIGGGYGGGSGEGVSTSSGGGGMAQTLGTLKATPSQPNIPISAVAPTLFSGQVAAESGVRSIAGGFGSASTKSMNSRKDVQMPKMSMKSGGMQETSLQQEVKPTQRSMGVVTQVTMPRRYNPVANLMTPTSTLKSGTRNINLVLSASKTKTYNDLQLQNPDIMELPAQKSLSIVTPRLGTQLSMTPQMALGFRTPTIPKIPLGLPFALPGLSGASGWDFGTKRKTKKGRRRNQWERITNIIKIKI